MRGPYADVPRSLPSRCITLVSIPEERVERTGPTIANTGATHFTASREARGGAKSQKTNQEKLVEMGPILSQTLLLESRDSSPDTI